MKKLLFLLLLTFTFQINAQLLPEKYSEIMGELMEMDYQHKLKHLDKVFKKNQDDPWYYWMKADVYSMMEDEKNTELNYRKALEIDSVFPAANASMGILILNRENGNFSEALKYFNLAIQYDPIELMYRIYRGETYLKLNDYSLAINDANFVLKNNEEFIIDACELVINIYKAAKQTERIKPFLMSYDFSSIGVIMNTNFALELGDYYESFGEHDKACYCYRWGIEPYAEFGEAVPEILLLRIEKCDVSKE